MKSEELKQYNWVETDTGREGWIMGWTSKNKVRLRMLFSKLDIHVSKLSPIKNSKEWLIKLGLQEWNNRFEDGFIGDYYFEIGDGYYDPLRFIFIDPIDFEVRIREIDYRRGAETDKYGDTYYISDNNICLTSVPFVHQIQNLYFDLTNKLLV